MKALMFSGGLDSMVLFHDLLSQGESFQCVFINYGQKNAEEEFNAVDKMCSAYGIKLLFLYQPALFQCSYSTLLKGNNGEHTVASDEIQNRNATLACVAAANLFTDQTITLLFGAHKTGAAYQDATPMFYTRLSKLLFYSTNGHIDCEAPYIRLTKKQIVKKAWDLAISPTVINTSVSCYEGNNCGKCPACKARRQALLGSQFETIL